VHPLSYWPADREKLKPLRREFKAAAQKATDAVGDHGGSTGWLVDKVLAYGLHAVRELERLDSLSSSIGHAFWLWEEQIFFDGATDPFSVPPISQKNSRLKSKRQSLGVERPRRQSKNLIELWVISFGISWENLAVSRTRNRAIKSTRKKPYALLAKK
jgi:hypothetical protein